MTTLPTRKHCSRCSRWLLTAVHFRARRRVDGRCIAVASECDVCHRARLRGDYKPIRRATRAERERRRELWRLLQWEKNRRDGVPERQFRNRKTVDLGVDVLVPVEPFRLWIIGQARSIGYTNLASAVGVDEKQVRRYKSRETSTVHLSEVDRWLVAFGDRATDLYG